MKLVLIILWIVFLDFFLSNLLIWCCIMWSSLVRLSIERRESD